MLAGSPAGKNGRKTLRKSAISGGTFFFFLSFFLVLLANRYTLVGCIVITPSSSFLVASRVGTTKRYGGYERAVCLRLLHSRVVYI
jgi:hypothetical protein